jgi:signal transduction histidine kinase
MATAARTLSSGAGPCWLRAESRRIRHRGSGIGLSVVRLLIEAMGGRVQVADAPGGGADFQLALAGGG